MYKGTVFVTKVQFAVRRMMVLIEDGVINLHK